MISMRFIHCHRGWIQSATSSQTTAKYVMPRFRFDSHYGDTLFTVCAGCGIMGIRDGRYAPHGVTTCH